MIRSLLAVYAVCCVSLNSIFAQSYTIDQASICFSAQPTRCLTRNNPAVFGNAEQFSVQIVLKSDNPKLISEVVQSIYVEIAPVSINCMRVSTQPENCPPGAFFSWFKVYENAVNPPSGIQTPITLERAGLSTEQLQISKKLREELKKVKVEVLAPEIPGKPGEKPKIKPELPEFKPATPPYYFRFNATGLKFLKENNTWAVRITVYERSGGVKSSDYVRIAMR